jgi:hypothetical protein
MSIWRDLDVVLLSIVTNLAADELRDSAPRLAGRIVRWLAHRSFVGDVQFAEHREVKLTAIVDRWPASMRPLVAVGLVSVLVAEAAAETGRVRVGFFAREIASSVRRQSVAALGKSYATTLWVCRAVSLHGNRAATAKVVVMRPARFRAVAITLFVAAVLLGDLAGATSVQLMPDRVAIASS